MSSRFSSAISGLKRFSALILKAPTGLFGLGLFLGIIAVSLWQQWSLAFGLDLQIQLAVSIVLSCALWYGPRLRVPDRMAQGRFLSYLIICLGVWSLLHPIWIESLTTLMVQVPISKLEDSTSGWMISFGLALAGWMIPATLWSAVLARSISTAAPLGISARNGLVLIVSGITTGLFASSIGISPVVGVFVPAIVTSIVASGVSLKLWRVGKPGEVAASAGDSVGSMGTKLVQAASLVLIGGLLACNLRLVNQLMPHGPFVIAIQFGGVLLGIAGGYLLSNRISVTNRMIWGSLFAGAASSILLAVQPKLVDLSLWMNSSLTSVVLLLSARVALLIAVTVPFGMAMAFVANPEDDRHTSRLVTFGMPYSLGIGAASFLLAGTIDLVSLMTGMTVLLVLFTGAVQFPVSANRLSLRTAVPMGLLAAMALSVPAWRSSQDAARTAKLLYSTPTLLAYRFGWDLKHLPYLDDVRMIDRREGNLGPLTLWRGRVAELYVRESGMPRAVVTKDSREVPQFSPDVLQAVYSLVLVDKPGRVLCLGLSGGVPLSTCLNFPIQEAVCIEGDSSLISLVRGPLAKETGFDPLSDDRVTLRRISPELAMMAQAGDPYDIILSSPPSSFVASGGVQFTAEYYQRVSRHLAKRGLFCQRFECIDYGLQPVQLVVKAMRSAFQRVMVIEPSVGELLVFGANSDDVFVPIDLASRLEAPHVCRVLARSGIDWSALLNLPSFDHEALGEICDESRHFPNSAMHGQLSALAPLEVMRWGNKLQEVQSTLTATRVTRAPFWTDEKGQTRGLDNELQLTRRSRLVEWLGDTRVSKELVRRLEEVASQQKLVRDNPDGHWWAYRGTLRKQLQDRPRTVIQQVSAVSEKTTMHPEDERRRDYFLALGNAATKEHPTRQQIAAMEEFLEPYDPLLTYFARQETADLLARAQQDPATELMYRLHVIYFAPTIDASVRNVATALETLVKHPEAIPDESTRFDTLNGLIQTLRVRWEVRQSGRESSSNKTLDDVNQSLIAIENAVTALDRLTASAGVSDSDWTTRKQVIERLMLRPLRSFRSETLARQARGQAQARAILEEAKLVSPERNEIQDGRTQSSTEKQSAGQK